MALTTTADMTQVRLALRNSVEAMAGITTGALAVFTVVAPNKIERSAGSFITDKFVAGSEAATSGFVKAANNTALFVQKVEASRLTFLMPPNVALVQEAEGAAATISVRLPALRALQGEKFTPPTTQRPWWRETLKPVASARTTLGLPARVRESGLYMVDLFYPAGYSAAAAEQMGRLVKLALFPGHTAMEGETHVTVMRTVQESIEEDPPAWILQPVTTEWWIHGFTPSA